MEHVIVGKLKLGRKIGSGSFEELYLDDIVNNFCDFKTLGVLHCIPTSNIEVQSRFGDFEMVDAGPVTPQQVNLKTFIVIHRTLTECAISIHIDESNIQQEVALCNGNRKGKFWFIPRWVCFGAIVPCFSDRKVHARYVNQVWRVGFQLEDKLEKGEIERAIKKLMADDDGKEMSVRAMELKEKVDVCTRKGSSSYNFSNELVELHHFILIASLRLEINLPC
ncbi:hypothetical protein ACFX1Q_015312 [Malus domestica]